MNRVRMLLGLLALFIFPCNVYCYEKPTSPKTHNGGCYAVQFYNLYNPNWYGTACEYNAQENLGFVWGNCGYQTNGYAWRISGRHYTFNTSTNQWDQTSSFVDRYVTQQEGQELMALYGYSPLTAYPNGCVQGACDYADTDLDGVCNSCDSSPALPNPKHCVWTQSVTADGHVAMMVIDQSGNCDGSQLVTYKNSAHDGKKVFWGIASTSSELTGPTCQGDDGTGNCLCEYPTSEGALANMSADPDTQVTQDLASQIQEQKENVDNPDYDTCPNIKSRCEAACLSRGGVTTNTCIDKNGTTFAECTCQNEYAFDIATPTDSPVADSSGGDPAQTGGPDSNSDGKDDTYAAVKDALNDSGINSGINTTNQHLNSLGNKVDTVGSSINGLGSAVNGVGQGIGALGEGINGLGTKIEGLGDKLDDIKDDMNQDITATGSAELPGENTYDATVQEIEEISLSETIGEFITNGLPIVSYFRGSYINIGSASPTMSTDILGKTITIDFSAIESTLHAMGLVLVSISTILAFMIIVHRG